jgi:hypothetical protein
MNNTVPIIAPLYLERKCVLCYSRPGELSPLSTGSSAVQCSLWEVAIGLGWPAGALESLSVRAGVAGRTAWNRVLNCVESGEIGVLMVRNLARVLPAPDQVSTLIHLCLHLDTLLIENGRVLPLDREDMVMPLLLSSVLSQFERDKRRRARWANARPE